MPRFGDGSWEKNAGWMSGEKPIVEDGQSNSLESASRIKTFWGKLSAEERTEFARLNDKFKGAGIASVIKRKTEVQVEEALQSDPELSQLKELFAKGMEGVSAE